METEGGKQRQLLRPLGPTSGSLSGRIGSRMSTHQHAEFGGGLKVKVVRFGTFDRKELSASRAAATARLK